jgi:hypothetical protein
MTMQLEDLHVALPSREKWTTCLRGVDYKSQKNSGSFTDLSGRLMRGKNLTHIYPRQKTMHKYIAQSRLGVWPDEIVIFIHV